MNIRFRVFIIILGWCWHLLVYPLISFGQDDSFELGGYAKYLYSVTEASSGADRLEDHLLHIRLNSAWYPTESFKAVFEIRLRGFYGDSVRKNPLFKDQTTNTYDDPELDAVLWDEKEGFGYGQVDRLYLDYSIASLQLTLGRQRIAWGTSLVWNVIDVFNTMSILDFDYEERAGVDAFRVQYYTGPSSKVELAVKPSEDEYKKTWAGLGSIHLGTYDLFLIAAEKNQRQLMGGAWTGYVGDAGFRGEFKRSEAPNQGKPSANPVAPGYGESLYESDEEVDCLVLAVDYTFANSFYTHTELLYNSNGKTKYAGAFALQAAEADMLSPARLSFFQEFAYDLTPLLRVSVFGIKNADDGSWLASPTLTWSAITNLDLTLTAFISSDDPLTEWGNQGNSVIGRIKFSF